MSKVSYDLSKIKAVVFDVDGVLSTSTIPLGDNGVPRRTVNTKDGFAMQLAVKRGLRLAIITGAVSPGITERFEGLGITEIFTGVGMKLPVFKEWIERNGLTAEEVVYVGDDIPDYECMLYLTAKDIDKIIVVNGPGSFTGIRIGITIAKVYAWSLNIPITTIVKVSDKCF